MGEKATEMGSLPRQDPLIGRRPYPEENRVFGQLMPFVQGRKKLSHLLHSTLQVEVGATELVGGRVLDLEALERRGKLLLDRATVLPLELGVDLRRRAAGGAAISAWLDGDAKKARETHMVDSTEAM